MLDTYLRPIYQLYFLDPIARLIKKTSPRLITFLACLTGILVAPALIWNFPVAATLFLLISGFLDTLDGTVARMSNNDSDAGVILDILSDRIVEFAVIMGLFALDPEHRGWLTLSMLGGCYLCMTCFFLAGFYSFNSTQRNIYYIPGLMERAEAFAMFLLMIWLPGYFNFLAVLFILLALLTCYVYLKQFMIHPKRAVRRY